MRQFHRHWHGLLLLALGIVAGCEQKTAPSSPSASRPTVRVVHPTVAKVIDYAYFTGRTDAIESVDVQARVTGYLDAVNFVPGSEVKAGQPLFKIDPRPYQATLDQAQGQLALCQARLKLAVADQARALDIAKTPGAVSQQDLDKYAAARSEAEAAVTEAEANCESARLNLEFTEIQSPIDGLASRNLLTVGNLVKHDETLLTTLVSQDPIYVYFDIDEPTLLRLVRKIQKGELGKARERNSATVDLALADEGDRFPHKGTVDFVENRVSSGTGTLQIRAEVPNPETGEGKIRVLSPGMFVRVRLPIDVLEQALLVPEAAIDSDQGNSFLLVVGDKDIVEYRPVTSGPQQPGGMRVVFPVPMVRTPEGLRQADEQSTALGATVDSIRAEDRVIFGGLVRVRPGMQVEVQPADAPKPAGKPAPATPKTPSQKTS